MLIRLKLVEKHLQFSLLYNTFIAKTKEMIVT